MRVRKDFLPGSGARDVEAAMRKGGPLVRTVRFVLATGEEETLVANMLASLARQADEEARKRREDSGNKWEYRANVSHAVGVYKDMILRL